MNTHSQARPDGGHTAAFRQDAAAQQTHTPISTCPRDTFGVLRTTVVATALVMAAMLVNVGLVTAAGDGSSGFVIRGVDQYDEVGQAVSDAGDVNGDGIGDIVIGANGASPYGKTNAGEAYVVFGRAGGFPGLLELASLFPEGGGDGSTGFVLKGVSVRNYTGVSVSGAGDINGDGIDDLIVGADEADSGGLFNSGESYVLFGRSTGFAPSIELSSLLPVGGGDGSDGFVIRGASYFVETGRSVSDAGDVNGDGIDDLIVGAYQADQAYVVFGRTTGFGATFELANLLPQNGGDGSTGFVLAGFNEVDYSGRSVSGAGDVNADGVDDLLIGAEQADANGREDAGRSYVVFGRAGGFPPLLSLADLFPGRGGDGSNGFVLKGIDIDDVSGKSVSNAGDINGDDVDDLVICAPYADPLRLDLSTTRFDGGECYVVFGRSSGFAATLELASLTPGAGGDGSNGFLIKGPRGNFKAGWSVSTAGDVNADGLDDLVIGSDGLRVSAGESYVLFGRATGFPAVVDLLSLFPSIGGDGSTGFVVLGPATEGNGAGWSVSGAGDVNADGIDDLVIGDPDAEPDFQTRTGESYVVFGRSTGFPPIFMLGDL